MSNGVLIDGEVHSLQEAYDRCGGKLKCRGVVSLRWELVDFGAEYGHHGRAYFLERLWFDGIGDKSVSTTERGMPVRLTSTDPVRRL